MKGRKRGETNIKIKKHSMNKERDMNPLTTS
jgi:hypothetical protein